MRFFPFRHNTHKFPMIQKFFQRRLIFFLLRILVPTIFIFTIFYVILTEHTKEKLQEQAAHSSAAAKVSVENIFVNTFYVQKLMTDSPRLTLALAKLLNAERLAYADVQLSNILNSTLYYITTSNLYTDSVYLYLNNKEYMLSSYGGLQKVDTYLDSQWVDEDYETNKDKEFWITKRHIHHMESVEPYPVVSLFQPLRYRRGVIVVNIKPDKFQNELEYMTSSPEESLIITDASGMVLFTNENGGNLYTSYEDTCQKIFTSDATGGNWVSINGMPYLLNLQQSMAYGIRIFSMVPKKALYQDINQYGFLFLISLLVLTSVLAILAYSITKTNFKHINEVLEMFYNAEHHKITKPPQRPQDEYEMILHNVINTFITSSYLQTQVALQEEKRKTAEMAALQMQINPHFLFNTLQTLDLKALSLTGTPGQLNAIISDLSDILKYSLDQSRRDVSLKDEIDYLHKYDNIQHYRYEDKYMLYYEYEEDILHDPFLRLILQPLVENSLYHGIKPLAGNGYIKVRIFRRSGVLVTTVSDSGVGMNRDELELLRRQVKDEERRNIGLTNVNRRLVLRYGSQAQLHIMSKKGMGTCITFRVPCGNT